MGWNPIDIITHWNPIAIAIRGIVDPDSLKEQFEQAGHDIADGGKKLVSNPLEYASDAASGAMADISARMDNPTGYVCDGLGVDQPGFLKDYNDTTNPYHQFTKVMDYANGKDLVPVLKHMKEVATTTTTSYAALTEKAGEAVRYYTDLAIANAHLVGIPESVLAVKLPREHLATLHDLREQMPPPDLGDDKPTNLFDVWKAGGSPDLPDGVATAIKVGRYALPTSIIWANIGSKIVNVIDATGRDHMKSEIHKWQAYLTVLVAACSNADEVVRHYTGLTIKEGNLYVEFARRVNTARAGEADVEPLAVPIQRFATIADLHDKFKEAQQGAARILGGYLADIPGFSTYLEKAAGLAKGYQAYLLKQGRKQESVEVAVDAYLGSALAKSEINDLGARRADIRRMLILITLWASVHHEELVLEGLRDWERTPPAPDSAAEALTSLASFHVAFLHASHEISDRSEWLRIARDCWSPDWTQPADPDFPAREIHRYQERWDRRWDTDRQSDDWFDMTGFADLLVVAPDQWSQAVASAPPDLAKLMKQFSDRVHQVDPSLTTAAAIQPVADALFDLGTAIDEEIDAGRLDINAEAFGWTRQYTDHYFFDPSKWRPN